MPGTDRTDREKIEKLLEDCVICREEFVDNVPLITDFDRPLTVEQVHALLIELERRHAGHSKK